MNADILVEEKLINYLIYDPTCFYLALYPSFFMKIIWLIGC